MLSAWRATAGILLALLVPGSTRWLRSGPVSRREVPELRADLYAPPGRRSPGIVLVLGALREGRRYEPLEAVARTLSGRGFAVLVPELGRLQELIVTEDALEDLVEATLALRSQPEVLARPVGVFGFSFGGGLALVAAADPRLRGRLACVATLGGYFSLPEIRELAAAGAELEQPVLDAISGSLAAAEASGLGEERVLETMERLSPSSVLERIEAPAWCLHDENDRYVPVEQAHRLQEAAAGRPGFRFFTTNLLEHTEPRPLPVSPLTLVRSYLPSLLNLMRFLHGPLRELLSPPAAGARS